MLFKKLTFIYQEFLAQFKKSFIPEKPSVERILLQNVFQWLRIEKLKVTFQLFSAMSGNTFFHREVLKHETEAMLT